MLWEYWIAGLNLAVQFRRDSWPAIALGGDASAIDALAGMTLPLRLAHGHASLMSSEIDVLCYAAPSLNPAA